MMWDVHRLGSYYFTSDLEQLLNFLLTRAQVALPIQVSLIPLEFLN